MIRVAKVAQKQPMETVCCLKLEKHRLRSSDFSNAPGAYSLAHVLCKVVQSVPERNPSLCKTWGRPRKVCTAHVLVHSILGEWVK